MSRPESQFIDLPGGAPIRIHYLDWGGASTPLILLHGLASNAHIWDLTAPYLVPHFRVIALDQRGHGLSDKPSSYSFDEVTSDLAGLIQALSLERPILVGHSWGGNVALQFAADHPLETAGIVLSDGGFLEISAMDGMTWERAEVVMRPPDIDGAPLAAFVAGARNWPDLAGLWSDQLQEMVLSNFEIRDEKVYRCLPIPDHMKIVRAIWEQRPSQMWDRVRCPVLMIPAIKKQDDPQRDLWTRTKLQAIEIARQKLQGAQVVVMEDTIHDIPIQRPKELAEAFIAFAKSIPP